MAHFYFEARMNDDYPDSAMGDSGFEKHPTSLDRIKLKLTEYALRESDERYRITFEHALIGIAHTAPSGQFLDGNQSLCDMLGYTKDELLRLTWQDLTHPDDLEASKSYLYQLLEGKIDSCVLEKRYRIKSGKFVWNRVLIKLLRFTSGRPKYFICTVEDVTLRKTSELEVQVIQTKLEQLNSNLKSLVAENSKWLALSSEIAKIINDGKNIYRDATP